MGWKAIHDAVQAAIVGASGLPATKVIWQYGNTRAPALPYIALKFNAPKQRGQDYVETNYDGTRPSGQEIQMVAKGLREVGLELECFTATTTDDSAAVSVLDLVRLSMILDPYISALDAADLSMFDLGQPIANVADVPATTFRGRASHLIRCYVPAPVAIAYTTYIASLSGTTTVNGARQGTITRPIAITLPDDD